jgi:glycine cleavage system H protein
MSNKRRKNNLSDNSCSNASRRKFIKDVGLVAGGVAVTSMFMPGCSSQEAQPTTSKPPASNLPTYTGGEVDYKPVMEYHLMEIEGCTSKVADDRLYSEEHIWVKQIQSNLVVIGFTDKLGLLTDIVKDIEFNAVGSFIARDESFGYAHGAKMSVELVSPVSGTIIKQNNALREPPYQYAEVINKSPYVNGWLLIIELSDPSELDDLLSPEEYAMRNRKEV